MRQIESSQRPCGTVLVDYECPHCQEVSVAPLRKVAAGPVGYWCCDACDGVFRVVVNLESIHLESPNLASFGRRRRQQSPSIERPPQANEQRLLELKGEELHIRSRLQEISAEAESLE